LPLALRRKKCVPRANNACWRGAPRPGIVRWLAWFDVFRVNRPSPPWERPVAERLVACRVVPLVSRDFPVFSPVPHHPRLVPASRPETADARMVRLGMQDWPHQNGEAITRVVITEVVSTKSPQNPGKSPPGPAWGHPDPDVWLTGHATRHPVPQADLRVPTARPPVPFARFPVSQTPFPVPPDLPLRAPPPCSRRSPVPTGRGHSPHTPSPTVVRSWPGTLPPDPSGGFSFVCVCRSSFVNQAQPLGREARSFAPARPPF
jgi:hypothetical protein